MIIFCILFDSKCVGILNNFDKILDLIYNNYFNNMELFFDNIEEYKKFKVVDFK